MSSPGRGPDHILPYSWITSKQQRAFNCFPAQLCPRQLQDKGEMGGEDLTMLSTLILGTAVPPGPCVSLALPPLSCPAQGSLTPGEAFPLLPFQGIGGCLPYSGSGIGSKHQT